MAETLRSILLVDADNHAREGLAVMLRKEVGCLVLEAASTVEAEEIIQREDISVLMTDLFLPQKSGIDLLKKVHATNAEIVTFAAVPFNDREKINEVLKLGVFFYIHAPYDFDEAVIALARGLTYHDLLIHKEVRGHKIRKTEGFNGIIGTSGKMQNLFNLIEKVAEDDISTVLIQGASGTGKELVARAIHATSPRRGKNFVPVNCAAIPEELLESELFGYVKGAFTGANQSKMGRVQYADGGTLFLDEIGDMKPSLQAKLLRVLQEKEYEPVGGVKPVPVDIRIVAATHRDLEKAVADGVFREDLYYRLSVVPLNIPPLCDRRDDIPLLTEKFVQVFNRNKKNPLLGFDQGAMKALIDYPWPGNVRELENLVQRMVILCSGKLVSAAELPEKYAPGIVRHQPEAVSIAPIGSLIPESILDGAVDFKVLVGEYEDRLIHQAMTRTGGNKKEAARLLNLKRTTLIEKIKKKSGEELETD